jgi:hypothetical protein
VFERGFYWYHSTIEDEVLMMSVAKHLEQKALAELRKEQGITYSPQASFARRGRGGTMFLLIQTSGQDRVVDGWYERTIEDLTKSEHPRDTMKNAIRFVADRLEDEVVRTGLSAIRGERAPQEALLRLDDPAMHARLSILLARDRAFGSSTPTKNVMSLVILGLFGALVLVVIGIAGMKFLRP